MSNTSQQKKEAIGKCHINTLMAFQGSATYTQKKILYGNIFLQPITNLKKIGVSHKIYIARNEGIYHLYLFKGNLRKIRDTYSTSGTLRMHYIGVFGDFLFTLLP